MWGNSIFDDSESDNRFSVGGSAVANGFDLNFCTASGQQGEIEFRVPDSDEQASWRFDWQVAVPFFFLFSAALESSLLWPTVLATSLIMTSPSALLGASPKRWHWVEHQAAMWLESYGALDFDTINPISTRCGTVVTACKALLFTTSAMVFWDYGWWALPLLASAATAWLITYRARVVFSLMPRPWRRLISVIAWPAAVIGCGLQRVLYMRRPSDLQRTWAKRWAHDAAPVIAHSMGLVVVSVMENHEHWS